VLAVTSGQPPLQPTLEAGTPMVVAMLMTTAVRKQIMVSPSLTGLSLSVGWFEYVTVAPPQ